MSDLARRLERYGERLEAKNAEPAPASPQTPALAFSAPQPTDTHRNLVDLLDSILSMGLTAGDGGHPMLRASLRTIRKLRPVALDELAKVPEDEVRVFLSQLVGQLSRAIGEVRYVVCPHCGCPLDAAGPVEPAGTGAGLPGGGHPDRQEHAG